MFNDKSYHSDGLLYSVALQFFTYMSCSWDIGPSKPMGYQIYHSVHSVLGTVIKDGEKLLLGSLW